MKKKIAISQSNYVPWKGYFDLINYVDVFVFLMRLNLQEEIGETEIK